MPSTRYFEDSGAAGGIRTHDIQNHNLALLPTELQPPQRELQPTLAGLDQID